MPDDNTDIHARIDTIESSLTSAIREWQQDRGAIRNDIEKMSNRFESWITGTENRFDQAFKELSQQQNQSQRINWAPIGIAVTVIVFAIVTSAGLIMFAVHSAQEPVRLAAIAAQAKAEKIEDETAHMRERLAKTETIQQLMLEGKLKTP